MDDDLNEQTANVVNGTIESRKRRWRPFSAISTHGISLPNSGVIGKYRADRYQFLTRRAEPDVKLSQYRRAWLVASLLFRPSRSIRYS